MMEAVCSSETMTHSQHTTRRNNPEHYEYSRGHENLEPYASGVTLSGPTRIVEGGGGVAVEDILCNYLLILC
jgi:hypothetical protein